MKLEKILKAIIIILILFIWTCIGIKFNFFSVSFNDKTNKDFLIFEETEINLMKKYYGEKVVKKMQKKIRKEELKISKKIWKVEKNGLFEPEVHVKVLDDADIPISKTKEEWYLKVVDIYNNQNLTKEEKEVFHYRIEKFYDSESKKMMNTELKEKIESILKEEN